jgi:hypothetical protein
MKQVFVIGLLLYSYSCFAQKSIHFSIDKVLSRDQNEIGTWNEWQPSTSIYAGIAVDFNDNEILWSQPLSDGKIKYITELLLSSKIDDKFKSVGFKYIKLTGAGLNDNKNITYEIAYLDQEIIMITGDGTTQTKHLLKEVN